MPPEMVDFPFEVQMAFLIHNLLPDRWDGMSGSYMGKDWSAYGALLDIYEIVDKKETTYFVKAIESENSKILNDELSRIKETVSKANFEGDIGEKINKVTSIIDNFKDELINEEMLKQIMKMQQLVSEIGTDD